MRGVTALLLLVALVSGATAHAISAEDLVADLNSPRSKAVRGIERAERSRENSRLLVIRVGRGWYAMTPHTRRYLAHLWRERWRHSVEHGVVAVLDARTDAPVVQFGPRGTIADVREPPRP